MLSRRAQCKSDPTLHIPTLVPMCEVLQQIHCTPTDKDSEAQSVFGLIFQSHGMPSTTAAGMTFRTWKVIGMDAHRMR